ncbi:MAG: hypothetical protein HY619_05995 [Thaumarchaeota archaeon]|nr:hypothetical protein [Nitrososphaerota archaeon]
MKFAGDVIGHNFVLKSVLAMATGTFSITVATYAALVLTGRFEYLVITAASTLAATLVGVGVKPSLLGDKHMYQSWPMPFLIGIGGVALAGEALLLSIAFPNTLAGVYALATLAGCSLTLWGNYLASSIRITIPVEQKTLADKILTP